MTNFTDLELSAPLLKALAAEGYETPTPIQAQAIPHLLAGRDLLGIAQTGTGKTAAFALPMLQFLAAKPSRPEPRSCRALVLSPTRELASQIDQSFRTYGRYLRLSHAVVFGGVSINNQIRALQGGVDILVATPGRLVDLLNRRAVNLSKVEIFVLDEADQMLDLGFIHAIRKLVGMLPPKRQNLFFSATMPKEISGLADGMLKNPARVEVAPVATTVERVEQRLIHVAQANKPKVLADLLADPQMTRTLVFTRTKHGADKVTKGLNAARLGASAIHGNKSQNQRERALAEFKAGKIHVLVATDIAARGIDIDGVSHVVNYDLPHVPESYVHRIGRTARAGAAGTAIAFCDPDERPLLRDIERLIRQPLNVMEHELALSTPAAGAREARKPQSQGKPRQHGRGGNNNAKPARAHGKPGSHGKPNAQGKPSGNGKPASHGKSTGSGKPSWMHELGHKGGTAAPRAKNRAVVFGR
ncbi:MAG: DEAD/DEAH box helicase [Hyphomicrobiales bacterium]